MKLYYKPGACSLAAHIVAREAGVPLTLEKVDLATKKTESGADFRTVNPNGYVPALLLPDGEVLAEAPVVLQYLADQKPGSGLLPAPGQASRYRALQWLSFVGSELHKNYGHFFKPDTPEAMKAIARTDLSARLDHVDSALAGKTFLLGDDFSAADAYAWVVMGWSPYVGIDLSPYRNIGRFMEAVAQRPAVRQALAAEGLA
ncbi:glutathione transferase GstA [Microvirga sp. M2]|uniref:glutathione transferase GstA n=1 Tax=Microvirga sp. M2 TaxID=3073270 RepID=UPI0039C0BA9F